MPYKIADLHNYWEPAFPDEGGGRCLCITSGGRIWVCFSDYIDGYTHAQVFAAYSDDNVNWTVEQVSDNDVNDNFGATIAIDGINNVSVVYWGQELVGGVAKDTLFHQVRGVSFWSSAENVAQEDSEGLLDIYSENAIAYDDFDHLHVMFNAKCSGDASPQPIQVLYRYKTSSWQSIEQVTTGSLYQMHPAIAIDYATFIHAVWTKESTPRQVVYAYRMSADNWVVSDITSEANNQYYPTIAVDSDAYPHVAWRDDVNGGAVVYSKMTGVSWETPEIVSGVSIWNCPQIALDNNDDVWIVWSTWEGGTYSNIHYRKRVSSGWQNEQTLTNQDVHDMIHPRILWATFPNVSGTRTNIIAGNQCVAYEENYYAIYFAFAVPVSGARSHAYIIG